MTYTVKRGDTLSEIAEKYLRGRIYGAVGSLKRLLAENSNIKNADYIKTGDVIELPDDILKNTDNALAISSEFSRAFEQESHSQTEEPERPYPEEVLGQEKYIDQRKDPASIDKFKTYSSFGFYPSLGFSRLDSTQTGSGSAVSEVGVGGLIDWTVHFSRTFEAQVYFNLMDYNYESSQSSTLTDSTGSMAEFGFGVTKRFTERFKLGGQLGYRSSPYLRGTKQNTGAVENVQAAVLRATPKYDILKFQDLSVELNAPIEYEFTGTGPNITTDGGFGYGLGLELKHETSWGEINAGGFYGRLDGGFRSATTSTQEIRSYLGIRYNIGGKKND